MPASSQPPESGIVALPGPVIAEVVQWAAKIYQFSQAGLQHLSTSPGEHDSTRTLSALEYYSQGLIWSGVPPATSDRQLEVAFTRELMLVVDSYIDGISVLLDVPFDEVDQWESFAPDGWNPADLIASGITLRAKVASSSRTVPSVDSALTYNDVQGKSVAVVRQALSD